MRDTEDSAYAPEPTVDAGPSTESITNSQTLDAFDTQPLDP
jgi:hypothetical protein